MAVAAALVLVTCSAAAGCGRRDSIGESQIKARTAVAPVAVVGGVAIGADDVRRQVKARGTGARQALDDLIAFELLARAAAEADHRVADTTSARELTAVKVQRLVEREIEPRLAPTEIPDGEVKALYERGKGHFVHGRLVQVAVLCVFTGARMSSEPRARAADNARKLKAFVDNGGARTAGAFESIANDPRWVERRVSITTVWQSEDAPFPEVVGRAVQALAKPGDITPLVGDETGYYVALYLSERGPENVSFADAAPALKREMYEPWRRQRFLQLTTDLAEGHAIEVFPENLPLLAADPATR